MNKAKLKSYAPSARRDFIQAVTDRASFFGISEKQIVPVEVSGDVAIIGGRPFPRAVAEQRRKLDARINRDSFGQVMEAIAYTWFNRFLALRYMELHGYLEHGYRVLSNPGGSNVPELLEQATNVDLPGLNKQKVVELKLDGSKDAELYRLLLVAQCNALNSAMPFLFERIEDETELLLPDNLLHSDSLIRKLVTEIEEEDWEEVEIIGWLYQFYISEKKDQVIGKVVKSEDIPAATQLFTPNWIVKYMVQNSLGRQWMATYPNSPLKAKMEYYIEPAEQTEEVNKQLKDITSDSLNPEKLTLLDPACGSGHILVEAYDVFKEIYLERGYSNRDFPRLILEKNLYGLDIDDRASQMAGFALLMKARKDDRRILRSDNPVKLNVLAIQESTEYKINDADWGKHASSIRELVELFRYGKTFGSLIQIPKQLTTLLPEIERTLMAPELHVYQIANELKNIIKQARLLSGKYECVVANPPYMGGKYLASLLKSFLQNQYRGFEKDLFSAFIVRNLSLTGDTGFLGFMTPMVWMFISSHDELRKYILENSTLTSLVQFEYNASGDVRVPLCIFSLAKKCINSFESSFVRLTEFPGQDIQRTKTLEALKNPDCGWLHTAKPQDFKNIPGSPFAYWLGKGVHKIYKESESIGTVCDARQGLSTGDTDKFIRFWSEVSIDDIAFGCKSSDIFKETNKSWAPYNKGGEYRKYYGNQDYVVLWKSSGELVKSFAPKSVIRNEDYYFKSSVSWSDVTSSYTSFRYYPDGFIFDTVGHSAFFNNDSIRLSAIGYLNGKFIEHLIPAINPTLHFSGGYFLNLPRLQHLENSSFSSNVQACIEISIKDWDCYERSWNFEGISFVNGQHKLITLKQSWLAWQKFSSEQVDKIREFEEANNSMLVKLYNLDSKIPINVPDAQISLVRPDEGKDCRRVLSYAIGCIMGRYSLDHPGLIYANKGNFGFNPSKYITFSADDDGIVPIMDMDWFPDDAASRFEEFLKVVWSPESLEENLKFVADSLSPKSGETPRETIRRYISTQFFKDHVQTYKKRPIYWLFSSGKQRAFECLVYLHRYNESTLSRMRNEYVITLQGKFSAQADYLSNEVNAVTSTADRNRLQKQLDTLRKKQAELASFDDLLRHYADQRISLDLDEGVKVNYGRFGNLLSDVKAITGGGE